MTKHVHLFTKTAKSAHVKLQNVTTLCSYPPTRPKKSASESGGSSRADEHRVPKRPHKNQHPTFWSQGPRQEWFAGFVGSSPLYGVSWPCKPTRARSRRRVGPHRARDWTRNWTRPTPGWGMQGSLLPEGPNEPQNWGHIPYHPMII